MPNLPAVWVTMDATKSDLSRRTRNIGTQHEEVGGTVIFSRGGFLRTDKGVRPYCEHAQPSPQLENRRSDRVGGRPVDKGEGGVSENAGRRERPSLVRHSRGVGQAPDARGKSFSYDALYRVGKEGRSGPSGGEAGQCCRT